MKNLFKISILGVSLAPLALAISCGTTKNEVANYGPHEYFLKHDIQDSKDRVHLVLENVNKQDIKSLPANINTYFNSHLVSGGFGEERHYYTGSSTLVTNHHNSNFHVGVDVLLPTNHNILSPVNGQVVAAFWKDSPALFYGIGGTVVIKSNISNMNIEDSLKEFMYVKTSTRKNEVLKLPKLLFTHNNIYKAPSAKNLFTVSEIKYNEYLNSLDSTKRAEVVEDAKYVYLTFMHLSRRSLNIFTGNELEVNKENRTKHIIYNSSIDVKNPINIKKGQLIGRVGTMADNGGWAPHVHLEAHSAFLSFGRHINKYEFNLLPSASDSKYNSKVSSLYYAAKPIGTYISSSLSSGRELWNDFSEKKGIIDPNNIYKLYDEHTKQVSFKF